MRKVVEEISPTTSKNNTNQLQPVAIKGFIIYASAFLLCILISLAPLRRFVGVPQLTFPTYKLFVLAGHWLPTDLHLDANRHVSEGTTPVILFLFFIGLAYVIYGLATRFLHRQPVQGNYRYIQRIIWLVAIFLGLLFVFMPAMLSHDIFVYEGYGRVLAIHHANPYFVTLSAYPHDPFIHYDDWRNAPAAYGPVWLAVCGLASLMTNGDPTLSLLVYRLLALGTYLLNILLISLILRSQRRSPRTITMGMLLYAWNPLVLEESCLGGHNDGFMVTLLLLGMFFSTRAEEESISILPRLRQYLPALCAFTLATLVKFTAAPIVVLYLILLARKAFSAKSSEQPSLNGQFLPRLRRVLVTVVPAGCISGAIALVFYAPYWIGARPKDIIASFTSTPSASTAQDSILYAFTTWIQDHGLPPSNSWTYPIVHTLSSHQTWSIIGIVTLACMIIAGAIWIWRTPTTRTLVLTAIATLGAVLVVTFWFYPWYLLWIMGLAAISLPVTHRLERALVAFTLVFSASSLCTYLYATGLPLLGHWNIVSVCIMLIPPLLTLFVFLALPVKSKVMPQPVEMN